MVRATADASVHWEVSARAGGELLTAEAQVPGLEVRVLGVPEGFTQEEVEGWLRDVMEATRELAVRDETPRPIPALLHHALTGLLFSHAAVWNPSGAKAPCSVALTWVAGEVGIGWVGDAEVQAFLDRQPIDADWTVVRDEQGREARAWCVDAERRVDLRLVGLRPPGDAGAPLVSLEATWPGVERPVPGPGDGTRPETAQGFVPSETPPLESESTRVARPSWGVSRWLERHFGRRESRRETADPESAEAQLPEPLSPVLPATEALPAEPPSLEPLSLGTVVADAPLSLEPSAADEAETPPVRSLQWPVRLPADVPDLIPPTPEPRLLTAQTIGANEPFDPRAIHLPRETSTIEPPAPAVEPPLELPSGLVSILGALPPGPRERPDRLDVAIPADASREAALELEAADAEPERPGRPEAGPAERRTSRPAPIRRPVWPSAEQLERPAHAHWWKWGGLAAFVGLLFGGGWLLGSLQSGPPGSARANPVAAALRGLGLAGPRFEAAVSSRPPGAWIAVDGKSLELRTPATLELRPGEHQVTLSFPALGSASYRVRGERDRVELDAPLWGALEVISPDPGAPITVTVDDEPRGFASLRVDSLAPGPHELRFSGPGMASWGQTVEIKVREERQLFTRPLRSPATGLLQVRAVLAEDGESRPLEGAKVWIDGQPRGTVPLALELPRGPHSVRVVYRGEEAPVQVIDLPGGNQRFGSFEFGLEGERPRLLLSAPPRIPTEQPVVVSATLQNVPVGELREMWLHVRTPDGRWRRYPMTLLQSEVGGGVGAVTFPGLLLGVQGQTSYYVSALTVSGDEYFTELQTVKAEGPQGIPGR